MGTDQLKFPATILQSLVIGVVGTVITIGLYDLKSDISSLQSDMGSYKTSLTRIEANRFTSTDGAMVWREIATIKSAVLPPEVWRERINGNSKQIAELKIMFEADREQRSRWPNNGPVR